jgi:asparagine synthase (glutamine-hydrolysing)
MTLSRETAHHVKVVLTGDGGDELFAGYRKYRRSAGIPGRFRWLNRVVTRLCPPHFLAACAPDRLGSRRLRAKLAQTIAPTVRSEYRRMGWEGWERYGLYQPIVIESVEERFCSCRDAEDADSPPLDPLNAALRLDQGSVLADRLLLKSDYATMAYGLESRAPLLDHRLAEVAGRLPLHLKATSRRTKVALREMARRYLPAEIVERRKKGFSMPLDRWFRGELRDFMRRCLLDESVTQPRFFQRAAIERLLAEHERGKNHAGRIHALLTFELWCREFLP